MTRRGRTCLTPNLLAGALIIAIALPCIALGAGEASRPWQASATNETGVVARPSDASSATPGLGRRVLWYVPNRLIDFVDIFRLRLRLGPGLAANVRMTDYGAFYFGDYHSVYAGLPGPRHPRHVRWPVGFESLNGVVIAGVDATDDTRYGPEYGATEVDIGAQLLLVGAEAGIDPFEIGDFLAGFVMIDMGQDDYPRERRKEPKTTSGVSIGAGSGMFEVTPKPAAFSSLADRLDYLHTNVQARVSRPVRTVDEYMAQDEVSLVPVPETRMRLGVYIDAVQGNDLDLSFSPDIDLDVAVPNIERRMRVFVQNSAADNLPGLNRSEIDNKGITAGARRFFENYHLLADAGLRTKWLPEAYARISWQPMWQCGKWLFRPQQRLFFETDDKFGELSTLRVDRWLGDTKEFYLGSVSSAKWTQKSDAFNWEQTVHCGRVRELIDQTDQLYSYERQDIASGGDVAFSIFGRDGTLDVYRVTVGIRRPAYRRWIYWEIEPGLEWRRAEDFDTAYRFTVGIDMLFWGPAYE